MSNEKAQVATISIRERCVLSKVEKDLLNYVLGNDMDLAISTRKIPGNEHEVEILITVLDLGKEGLRKCPLWLHPEKERLIAEASC